MLLHERNGELGFCIREKTLVGSALRVTLLVSNFMPPMIRITWLSCISWSDCKKVSTMSVWSDDPTVSWVILLLKTILSADSSRTPCETQRLFVDDWKSRRRRSKAGLATCATFTVSSSAVLLHHCERCISVLRFFRFYFEFSPIFSPIYHFDSSMFSCGRFFCRLTG